MESQGPIFIVGGHLSPAIAVIEEIKRQKRRWDIVFVGRRYAQEGDETLSQEYRIITDRGIRFLPLTAGRIQRYLSWSLIRSCIKIPVGFLQGFRYTAQERPAVIVSFGGYLAVPIAFAGWLLGIPVVTHEQTVIPGLANRVIARFARKIFLTFTESSHFFPERKTIVTGLPLRSTLFLSTPPPFSVSKGLPVIYITGGSTGAASLNYLVFPLVAALVKSYTLIHQTGSRSYEEAEKLRNTLEKKWRSRYIISPFYDMHELAWILKKADLVVGRSGANTVVELAVLGKPSIFLPLPWSGHGEQQANAKWLERHGAAFVLDQKKTTPKELLSYIYHAVSRRKALQVKARRAARLVPKDAARRMVQEIANILSS